MDAAAPPPALETRRLARVSPWLKLITALVALGATAIAVRHAGQPLLEAHPFRQTQTALTAFWMIRDGWHLAYETPVAGFPWAIPFEFPLYQALVAAIAKLGGLPLDPVGRLVSFGFLLACAWPASGIARRLALPREVAWLFCALLWSSPVYLFWGRTFMIETAALFFAVVAIQYGIDLLDPHPRWSAALLCMLFATAANLQKLTSGTPVVFVLGCLWLLQWWKHGGLRLPTLREIAIVTCAFGVPLVLAAIWTRYTDVIKAANPFGLQLTSAALRSWNLGTLQQRLDPATYRTVLWERMLKPNAGGIVGALLIVGALTVPRAAKVRAVTATALALFLLPVLMFTNLHVEHDYYQASCGLFLVAALAVAVGAWLPTIVRHPALVPLVTLLLVASNVHAYARGYAPLARMVFQAPRNRVLAVAEIVRKETPVGSGFVAFGREWSSELAYYAERKSFTVPPYFRDYARAWSDPAGYLGPIPLKALVVCPSDSGPSPAEAERRAQAEPRWRLEETAGCAVLIDRSGG